ncbi:MAG: hypothetical protein O7D86_04685 [Proteobacteria bacterium]|nr:hypothetical protein [Pseudomonadota bacterium]
MQTNINRIFVVLITGIVLFACKSQTVVNEYKAAPVTELEKEDSIVVLGRRHKSQQETELDYIDCVSETLAAGSDGINVIPEKQFIDSMYPYFETSTAPMDVRNLDKLVQKPEIAKKFADYHIRYFVWIEGYTETTDTDGSMACAIGPGGGGCFGYAQWDDKALYEASIWDFNKVLLAGKISTKTEGTSYLPAVIIPIPFLASVKANACSSMATQLKLFLQ